MNIAQKRSIANLAMAKISELNKKMVEIQVYLDEDKDEDDCSNISNFDREIQSLDDKLHYSSRINRVKRRKS